MEQEPDFTKSGVTAQGGAVNQCLDRDSESSLEQAFTSLNGLVASLAHELGQPLCSIIGYCEGAKLLLSSGTEHRQEIERMLDQTIKQARRSARIMRHLGDLQAKQRVRKDLTDFGALIRSCIDTITADVHRHRATLKLDLAEGLPPVMADAILIEEVLFNLLRNSLEAMTAADTPVREVVIRTHAGDNGTVQVTVQNTGPTLDRETAQHIFEPCFTTKTDGLGLGLWISRRIIRAHRGCLWAETGQRTAFHFTLPVASQ